MLCDDCGKQMLSTNKRGSGSGSDKFKITTDLPILDIISVLLSFLSLFITIFIATGIIKIHRTVKQIDGYDNDNGNNNDHNNNNANDNHKRN